MSGWLFHLSYTSRSTLMCPLALGVTIRYKQFHSSLWVLELILSVSAGMPIRCSITWARQGSPGLRPDIESFEASGTSGNCVAHSLLGIYIGFRVKGFKVYGFRV